MDIDDLLGVVILAAAGMFAAIVLQPVISGAAGAARAHADTLIVETAVEPAAPIVRLLPIDVVGRRSVEFAHFEREVKLAHPPLAKDVRPKA